MRHSDEFSPSRELMAFDCFQTLPSSTALAGHGLPPPASSSVPWRKDLELEWPPMVMSESVGSLCLALFLAMAVSLFLQWQLALGSAALIAVARFDPGSWRATGRRWVLARAVATRNIAKFDRKERVARVPTGGGVSQIPGAGRRQCARSWRQNCRIDEYHPETRFRFV